jgi:copper chaperone CopZ
LVQRDLEKIEGITNIKTDRETQTASFTLTNPDVDYKAKLEEFAKTNSKLKGFEIQ